MSNIAIFRAGETPEYLTSVNEPPYVGDPDVLIDPDITAVIGVPVKYWKRVNDTIVEMSQAEKDAVDAAIALISKTANRTAADSLKDNTSAEGIAWRALALLLLDELNALRQWTVNLKTETASANNLADFKSRVATLPTLSDRTITQVKTAYNNKINNGTAD